GRGQFASWRAFAESVARAALQQARASELADLCDIAEDRLYELLPALHRVREARLIHGDAGAGNVLCRDGRIVAWVDFEYSSGADSLYELTFVGGLFEAGVYPGDDVTRARAMESFARGYSERALPSEDDPDRVAYYRIVHALRQGEFLRVVGPTLGEEERARAVALRLGALRRAIAGSGEG
ncbi:MAG TPA: phosphotransferase, partial [Gemmatimonadaceae bacterium]|nr:phosphotransferase [Gemmatimonadaceae bacterium]